MTADAEQICSEICELLQTYNKAGVALTGSTDLTADLEMDSVAAMNLVMEIEDKYEIDIPINLFSIDIIDDRYSHRLRSAIAIGKGDCRRQCRVIRSGQGRTVRGVNIYRDDAVATASTVDR